MTLVEDALTGNRRALARLISLVEEGRPGAEEAMTEMAPHGGRAHLIGITGLPGAGKSTLTSELISRLRHHNRRVGVVAVDPSSPFTGGAVLGDRIRMQAHVSDPSVFVRSMANRGHPGGLAATTGRVTKVLDAAGYDPILVETVGVGQSEVEIVRLADTVVVIVTPHWGDGVQADKAGLLEIADIFCINQADRGGAEQTRAVLMEMLSLGPQRTWAAPIVATVAVRGEGVDQLLAAILDHHRHLQETGELIQRRARWGERS